MALWYRYVEAAEWADVLERGVLRAGSNSCGDGKWVAECQGDAWSWGQWLDTAARGNVLTLEVPTEVVARMLQIEMLDGIGPAAYIDASDLPRVHILEVLEITP